MPMPTFVRVLALVATFTSGLPGASAEPARPEPAQASAPVPPLAYQSLLGGYRSFANAAPIPWRQANDTAAAIGGWRAYAREAARADPPAAAASAAREAVRSAP